MQDKKQQHPGSEVVERCLKPHGLTVTEAAEALGVTRNTLSRLINGRHGISADMAVRLSLVFGAAPEMWQKLQSDYDLVHARMSVAVEDIRGIGRLSRHRRSIIRRSSLKEDSSGDDLRGASQEQRILTMWRLTRDAWAFKGVDVAESRLSRHTVHIRRG